MEQSERTREIYLLPFVGAAVRQLLFILKLSADIILRSTSMILDAGGTVFINKILCIPNAAKPDLYYQNLSKAII